MLSIITATVAAVELAGRMQKYMLAKHEEPNLYIHHLCLQYSLQLVHLLDSVVFIVNAMFRELLIPISWITTRKTQP